MHMRTTFEIGILHNGQQPGSSVNSFIDQGEFGAMKTLSGRISPHCDTYQFCDKMTVNTQRQRQLYQEVGGLMF